MAEMAEINFSLLSEVIFTNDKAFKDIDTPTAKMLKCVSKNASLNKNIQMKIDVCKARYYFNKITDIINSVILNKEFFKRQHIGIPKINLTDFITEFDKENEVVKDGFRELIVIQYKLSLHYYTKARDYEMDDYLEDCVQYKKVLQTLGYYDYYKNYVVSKPHFIMSPENLYEYIL
jgi:hypothetical protein